MKKISVILPKADNDGASLDWNDTLKDVAETFGGYTVSDVSGGWVSDNKLYKDESYRLEMSFTNLTPNHRFTILALIKELFKTQLAVFVEMPQGAVILEEADLVEFGRLLNDFK